MKSFFKKINYFIEKNFTLFVLLVYTFEIILFAIIYLSLDDQFSKTLNLIDSLYLSVITITTLGYGDITPVSNLSKLLTASESILGLATFGWLLNMFWKDYTEKLYVNRNRKRIISFKTYLNSVISNHRKLIIEITNEPENVIENIEDSFSNINPIFSDLSNLFRKPVLIEHMSTSLILLYLEKQNTLKKELKYFLANYDLEEYQKLYSNINEALIGMEEFDSLSFISTIGFSNEDMVTNQKLNSIFSSSIKKYKVCPDFSGSITLASDILLVNIAKLYRSIVLQIKTLNVIEAELNKIELS